MASNDYHFVTRWELPGTCEEVYDVLRDPLDLSRWWPSVYLEVQEVEPGDESGVGKVVELLTKGKLPYKLEWHFKVTRVEHPRGFSLEAWGDFVGRGEWTFTQNGHMVSVVYDWKIRADKPLLRRLSFLLKPVFSANHRWAMDQGEICIRRELERRKANETQ